VLGGWFQALVQRLGLANEMGQASQPLIQFVIGPAAVAYQPALEGRAEDLAHYLKWRSGRRRTRLSV
jgi:hypothetical protein